MSRILQRLIVVVVICVLSITKLEAQSGPDVMSSKPVKVELGQTSRTPRLMPTDKAMIDTFRVAAPDQTWGYDPTSVYDQKGVNVPRGFSAAAPNEIIDPFSGNLVLYHTDLRLPGVAGLDLTLMRVYNSKIHRNYAARASGDPNRVAVGMLFVPASPVGLGWTMHLGRLVGAVEGGPNAGLSAPRYYERPDGSQHPFFTYTGPGCGDEQTDVCLRTKEKDNPYFLQDGTWRVGTTDGRIITFDHTASDGSTVIRYATEIRDIHGNRIQIFYHGNTIPGIPYEREEFRHFIDRIVDSANRVITFGYSEVNPGLVRLTSITAVGRTYQYAYSTEDPWSGLKAFLVRAQPPEGAPWRYDYAGLYNGDCADNSNRWCELTQLTYPHGGTITYSYQDHTFWAQTNPMAVRAVATREESGRDVPTGMWTYDYNRAADYTGEEHTVITRPDNSKEVYTYFGVGNGPYNPLGLAWKAGVLLRKQIQDDGGGVVHTETLDWEPSPAISDEVWGDPWIGFDNGVFVARLRQQVIQRGNSTWTATHTSYNDVHNLPRCTTEQGPGNATRYRLHSYYVGDTTVQGEAFRFRSLPELDLLSYNQPSATYCDDGYEGPIIANTLDELERREYNAEGQLAVLEVNGVRTDADYYGDGTLKETILYQEKDASGDPALGFCTSYSDYSYGVARRVEYGAPAPGCSGPIYSVQRSVNADGSLASVTNGRGHTTGFDYDGLGRVIAIHPPGEDTIVISYDGGPTNFSTSRRVSQGAYWLESRFDGLKREIEKENSAGVRVWQSYDTLGRITFQSLPSYTANSSDGNTYTYDGLNRVESITHADNTTRSYAYDADVQSVTITDELQRQTVLTRRAFGDPDDFQLVRVQLPGEPAPAQDTYTYLVGGYLTNVNYAGRQRTIGYNFAKKVVREYTPERFWVYWGYDAAGNVRCHDRSAFSVCSDTSWNNPAADIRYTVDGLGRVTQVDYESAAMTDVAFTYDAADNLETMMDGVGSHTYAYTPTNRLEQKISVINGVEYITGYTYDSRGNTETLTYPSGRTVTYGYDVGNRLVNISGFVSNIDYHANGIPSDVAYANGVASTSTLDPRQRLDELNAPGVLNLDYDYDAVGNVDRIVDGINAYNSMDFDYDDLDRLTDANGAWGSLHYDYNAAGDRTLERLDGQNTIYSYDSLGHLTSLSGRINLNFDVDSFGNARQRGPFHYDYDLEDRITDVTDDQSNPIVAYGYNGRGERVLFTRSGCNSAVVHHFDQQGARIAESTRQGLILKEYIVADGRTVAEIDLAPLSASPGVVDFGDVGKGASMVQATRSITLTNRSGAPLTIDAVSMTGSNFTTDATAPLQVPANGSAGVAVTLTADELSEFSGQLTLCVSNGMQLDVRLLARTVPGATAANSHTAPPDTSISYTYPEALDPTTVGPETFAAFAMLTGQILGTYHIVNSNEIAITPDQGLKRGELIYVSATTGVRYQSGGGPNEPMTWQFQVAPATGGNGLFADSGQALGESGPSFYSDSVALGDVDDDGDLDAFVVNGATSGRNPANKVWLNDGAGIFSDSGQNLGDHFSRDVALGDLDGDGDLDAVVANDYSAANEVWLNDGNGVFSANGSLGDSASQSVAMGDLDGDGDLDAFVGNFDGSKVWINDGAGAFSDSGQLLDVEADTLAVALGDLDGDGDLDAYAANMGEWFGQPGYGWPDGVWLNDGAATFSKDSDVGGDRISRDVALGDVDNDGDLDALISDGPTRIVRLNNGAGRFNVGDFQYLQNPIDSNIRSFPLTLSDLDGDGDLDAFVGTSAGAEVWYNDGAGGLGSTRVLTDTYKIAASLGDLDGDGDLDAFLINSDEPNQVWFNQVDPSMLPDACAPDANGDGYVNIVDIQQRAGTSGCLPYLPTIAGYWHEPWPNNNE